MSLIQKHVVFAFLRGKSLGRSFLRGKFGPKRGNKNFYKGYGARRHGKFDSKEKKVPELVVPDLTGFTLKPYVSRTTPKIIVNPPKLPVIDLKNVDRDKLLAFLFPNYKSVSQEENTSVVLKKL